MRRSHWLYLLAAALALGVRAPARADVYFDTFNWVDIAWGYFTEGSGTYDNQTWGQTFVAPSGATALTSFRFNVQGAGQPNACTFDFMVAAWDDGANHAVGPILHQSGPYAYPANSPSGALSFTFPVGSMPVTPGQKYVAFITVSNRYDGTRDGNYYVQVCKRNPYPNGDLVYAQNRSDVGALFSAGWVRDTSADMGFRAEFASPTSGSIIYVKPDGSDANDGGTWDTAKQTINAAAAQAVAGNQIWVAQGFYSNTHASLAPGVALYGGLSVGAATLDGRAPWSSVLDASKGGAPVFLQYGSGHIVDGFTLQNGWAGVDASGGGTISNNLITGNSGGAGIHGWGANLQITGNLITGNTNTVIGGIWLDGSPACTVSGNFIEGNAGSFTGGVSTWNCPGLVVRDNTITGNNGGVTGGVWIDSHTATVQHNEITDNDGGSVGGVFRVNGNDLQLIDNTITGNTGNGDTGGVRSEYGTLTVRGNTISDNQGNWHGGTIVWRSTNTLIESNTYAGNQGSASGAINLVVENRGPATVRTNTIEGNHGGSSGAVLASSVTQLLVQGNTVKDNTGTWDAGIYTLGCGDAQVIGNTVTGNTCPSVAGIDIYAGGGTATIAGNTVSGNTGNQNAGGIWVLDHARVAITDNTVTGNTSGGAGGIHVLNGGPATISGNQVIGNTGGLAGGLRLWNANASVTSNTFAQNTGSAYGAGGIDADGSTVTLDGNVLWDNTGYAGGMRADWCSIDVHGNQFTYNEGGPGGGITAVACYTMSIVGNTFDHNTGATHGGIDVWCGQTYASSSARIRDNAITNNTGGGHWDAAGGGQVTNVYTVEFVNNRVEGNTCSSFTGGFTVRDADTATVTGNTVTSNTGGKTGGLRLDGLAHGTVTDNIVQSNKGVEAGGVHLNLSPISFARNVVSGNSASDYGGGVLINACNGLDVRANTISGNTGVVGGLISWGWTGTAAGNEFVGNTGMVFGGLHIDAGNVKVDGNLLRNNKAPVVAAAWVNQLTGEFNNNRVEGNQSPNCGGIYFESVPAGTAAANNLVRGNVGGDGGAGLTVARSAMLVANNTVTGNLATSQAGISCSGGTPTLASNIVAFNTDGISSTGGAIVATSSNCVYGNGTDYVGLSAGTGDISADPQFVNAGAGKFNLLATSPCINAGDNAFVSASWADLLNQPRLMLGRVDMGACEFQGPWEVTDKFTISDMTSTGFTLTANQTLSGPVMVVIDIQTKGVKLGQFTGMYKGSPYLDMGDQTFAPGQQLPIPLQFVPAGATVSYSVRVYLGTF